MTSATLAPQPWLAPLGSLVGGAVALRAALYRARWLTQSRLDGPVISVGNLSVGGSGKTPVVAMLARLLLDEGHAVSILSRGYGGRFRGDCLIVSDGRGATADAAEAGDEPVMLARAIPQAVVAIGRRRDVVGREVERRFGRRVHLLDDGFQHLRLARDLDVVCVAPRDLSDRPLPAGWLREAPRALRRADLILVFGEIAGEARELDPGRTFRMTRRVCGFFTPAGEPTAVPARAYVVSAIARPERLIADLTNRGIEIAGHARFADHHRFRVDEIEAALEDARRRNADAAVTTEKDLVRFPILPDAPPLRVIRIAVAADDEARLRARVLAAVSGRAR